MANNSDLKFLRERLYKKEENFGSRFKRGRLNLPRSEGAKTYWAEKGEIKREDLKEKIKVMGKKRKGKFFWVVGVGICALAAAGFYLFFMDGNIVSSRNIELSVEGPFIINSGEFNKWYVSVTNNNNVKLELADLLVEYPDGFLSESSEPKSKERHQLGEIEPGQTAKEEISFLVLGAAEQQKDVDITLEYRLEDSNAIFAKTEKETIQLSRSPLGISVNAPKEIESGQEVILSVECISNSEAVLKNLYLKAFYPPGFKYLSSGFEPVKGKDIWLLGDLAPGEKRTLDVKGILEGQDLTEVAFKAEAGWFDLGVSSFTSFGGGSQLVLLKRPFLNLAFLMNGKETDAVYSDKSLNIVVPWKNNLPSEIRNVSIKVFLSGNAVDLKKLSIEKGFYRSYDNAIVWNSSSFSELSSLAPGEDGAATFSFELKNPLPVTTPDDKNFTINLKAEMSGSRTDDGGQTIGVKSVLEKEIKIASVLQLNAGLFRSSGPFESFGPLPPRVGKETSYAVVWTISNFYNNVNNAVVKASLPPYVSWAGMIDPASENLSYNSSTGEVIWNVGTIEAGAGVLKPAKKVAFKIVLLPSLNQEGEMPVLVNPATLEGEDEFTGLNLADTGEALKINSIMEAQTNSALGRVAE